MTPARHGRAFAAVFGAYTAWLLRRRFSAVWAHGSLPRTLAPLLIAVQHVSWWDPMILFHLSRTRFGGKHFVMMEEANLRRLRFFRRIGAFGIERSSRADVVAAMRYGLARLREPGSRVWIFPQGELVLADDRPIVCHPGAAWLAARSRVPTVAVALRYEFLDEQFPQAFVRFSEPRLIEWVRDGERDPIATMLEEQADRLRDAVTAKPNDLDLVVRGRRSLDARFSAR